MQLAVNSWSYRQTLEEKTLDLPGLLTELHGTGLTALEVAGAHFANRNDIYLEELLLRSRDTGVRFVSLDLVNDFAWPEPSERERQTRDVIAWMDLIARLDIRLLHIRTGRARPEVRPARSQIWVRQCLARILPEAEARDCTLALDDRDELFEDPTRLIDDFANPSLTHSLKLDELTAEPHADLLHLRAHFGDDEKDSGTLVEAIRRLAQADYTGLVVLEYLGRANPTEALKVLTTEL